MSWLGSQEKLTFSDTDQSPVALNYNIASNMANFIGEMDQKNGSRKKIQPIRPLLYVTDLLLMLCIQSTLPQACTATPTTSNNN